MSIYYGQLPRRFTVYYMASLFTLRRKSFLVKLKRRSTFIFINNPLLPCHIPKMKDIHIQILMIILAAFIKLVTNQLIEVHIYKYIYIMFNYKICFMSKVETLNAAVFITNSPLSKDQFSEFRSEQMLITKSFYFLYSHFQQSYYSNMYMVLNAVNTLVNWSNKSFTIIRFNRYTKHTYT